MGSSRRALATKRALVRQEKFHTQAGQGPWRGLSEELLDCCVSLDQVRARPLPRGARLPDALQRRRGDAALR